MPLVHELDGLVHALDALSGAGAVGGEGQEAHARLPTHDGAHAVGGADGNGGQLGGIGLGVEAAVGEADDAALGALEAWVSTRARMEGTSTPSARPMVIWAHMSTSPVVLV